LGFASFTVSHFIQLGRDRHLAPQSETR